MTATITPPSTSPVAVEPTTGPIALAGAPRPAGAPKPKPRKRVNTAEKRHQHNAIERQRRETLNGKFLVLARLLPSLASCRRPSKSAIVNGSISHLKHQRQQRLLSAKVLRQLVAERDEMLAELNEWRAASGFAKRTPIPVDDEIEEICAVEKETFGSFANVDENAEEQNEEDEDSNSADMSADMMNLEQAALIAGSFLTPRSSADMGVNQGSYDKKPNVNGIAWNNSFAVPNVPFNAFMAESHESSASPNGSQSSHPTMLTPPNDQAGMYTHTPSPCSSGSAEEPSAAAAQAQRTGSLPATWTPQQLAFFQQAQTFQRHQHHQQQLAALASPNLFLGNPQQASPITPTSQQTNIAQLMASMFPPQRDMMGNDFGFINSWSDQSVSV